MTSDALERAVTAALDNFAGFPILRRTDTPPLEEEMIGFHVPFREDDGDGMRLWFSWPAAWELAARVLCDAPAALTTDQVCAVSAEVAEEICMLYLLARAGNGPVQPLSARLLPPNAGAETPMGVTFLLEIGTLTVSLTSGDTNMELLKERARGITQLLHSYQ